MAETEIQLKSSQSIEDVNAPEPTSIHTDKESDTRHVAANRKVYCLPPVELFSVLEFSSESHQSRVHAYLVVYLIKDLNAEEKK